MNTKKQIDSFKLIGISVRTSNENGKATEDLTKLWNRFFQEEVSALISNKLSEDVYCIYTDYASDYKDTYTAIIGFRVDSLDRIADGFVGRNFEGGQYRKYTAKGAMPMAVVEIWNEIWAEDKTLNRAYTADFEVYKNGEDSEAEIYIAIK